MIKLDLKKFKHVKSDDKSTTLKHSDGHELTIAHKALSNKMREQLNALAGTTDEKPEKKTSEPGYKDGGKVKAYYQHEDFVSKDDSAPTKEDAPIHTTELLYDQAIQAKNASDPIANLVPGAGYTRKEELFTPNSDYTIPENFDSKVFAASQDAAKGQQEQLKEQEAAKLQAQQDEQARMASAQQSITQPDSSVGKEIEQVPQEVSAMKPLATPTPSGGFNIPRVAGGPESQLKTATENVMHGLEGKVKAETQKATADAAAIDASAKLHQEAQDAYQQKLEELGQERQGFIHDIEAGHIDPEKYWENHSRIATGIGMILSGFGGVEGVKATTDYINREQEQNIQAQARNLASKESLLSHNVQQYGNMKDAMNATRMMQNDMLNLQLNKAAAKAVNPMAKAAALQAAGMFQKQNIELSQQIATRQTAQAMTASISSTPPGQLNKQDPSALVRYIVPQEHQKEVFAEIEAAQNTKQAGKEILSAFDKSVNNVYAVDFVPGMLNAEQKALHTLLGPTFKDVEGTVRQAAMDNLFANVTPQFGDNKNTSKVKREALMGYLTSKASAPTAKGYGIDLGKFESTATQAHAPEYKTVNGIKYMRGPNGEAIEVK